MCIVKSVLLEKVLQLVQVCTQLQHFLLYTTSITQLAIASLVVNKQQAYPVSSLTHIYTFVIIYVHVYIK